MFCQINPINNLRRSFFSSALSPLHRLIHKFFFVGLRIPTFFLPYLFPQTGTFPFTLLQTLTFSANSCTLLSFFPNMGDIISPFFWRETCTSVLREAFFLITRCSFFFTARRFGVVFQKLGSGRPFADSRLDELPPKKLMNLLHYCNCTFAILIPLLRVLRLPQDFQTMKSSPPLPPPLPSTMPSDQCMRNVLNLSFF